MQIVIPVFLSVLLFNGSLAKICKANYFWRPFKGYIPPDAFIAGEDAKGNPTYVASAVSLDQYLWTVPAQLNGDENFVSFNWYGLPPMKVDKFIHILCIDENHTLQWTEVSHYLDDVVNRYCLVEAGIGKLQDSQFVNMAYVGRKIHGGVSYIGRVYNNREWDGVHVVLGGNSTKFRTNFEILTYKPN